MPSPKKCGEKYKKGSKQYKDCIAYRIPLNKKVTKEAKAVDTKKRTLMGKPVKELKGIDTTNRKKQSQRLMKKIESKKNKGY